MFGNLQGWLVSLVLVVLTGGMIYWKGTPEGISKPTGALAAAMAPAGVSPDPGSVVPPGTLDADAGPLYRELAANVKANAKAYEAFQKATGAKKLAAVKPIDPDLDLLVRAGDCARMDLFASKPEEVVNYANRKPVLPELADAGGYAVSVAGLWLSPADPKKDKTPRDADRGRRLLEAVFRLGRHLAAERVVFDEYRVGVDLMGNAATLLAKFGGVDESRRAALLAFADGTALGPKYLDAVKILSGIPSEGKAMAKPGDIFDVALNGREPMWRTEAALKLGRMRWMVGVKYGDQRGATTVLKDLAGRPDLPANVKAAAVAGRDLTVDKFNLIGGSS